MGDSNLAGKAKDSATAGIHDEQVDKVDGQGCQCRPDFQQHTGVCKRSYRGVISADCCHLCVRVCPPSHRMKTVRSCFQCSTQVSCLARYVMALHSGLADHRAQHHWHDRVVGQLVARPECVGNMLLCEPEN